MCTGTVLPLAQWNILSAVRLGSKGNFQRAWKERALRSTRRVSSVREPDCKKSGMAPGDRSNNIQLHGNEGSDSLECYIGVVLLPAVWSDTHSLMMLTACSGFVKSTW